MLAIDNIDGWFDLPSGFKVGLIYGGEFRIGADSGQCMIIDKAGRDWINLGSTTFYFPKWNAGGVKAAGWNNPLGVSPDGNYLVLNWLYRHRHSAISPVLIHLPSRTYQLVEPGRIVIASAVTNSGNVSCEETVWENSEQFRTGSIWRTPSFHE